jgi:putative Mg2+ transporter-C (MgtC) family protein
MQGLATRLDLPALAQAMQLHVLLRLLTAVILGAAVGLEREVHGKQAGLRTHTLIALGAALLTVMSVRIPAAYAAAYHTGDVSRIASNIATGVGFLGAGVILHSRGRIIGLTTAATIWVVAAIGVASGAGEYVPAVGTCVLVLVVLVPLRWWERRAARLRLLRGNDRRRKPIRNILRPNDGE